MKPIKNIAGILALILFLSGCATQNPPVVSEPTEQSAATTPITEETTPKSEQSPENSEEKPDATQTTAKTTEETTATTTEETTATTTEETTATTTEETTATTTEETTATTTEETTVTTTEETTAQTPAPEDESAPENNDISDYERYQNMITELAPKEIMKKQEGVIYPEWKRYTYYSSTAERDTPVNVLLPNNYTESKKYPVLYILHGYYDNEAWMTRDVVRISSMLTNLINSGEAKEMIIVCPYIYCSKDMQYCTGMDTQNTLNYDNFINDLTTDLMPFINENFSVAKGRENTAITGFSMGGRESLFIGVKCKDIFGYVGSVCTAPGLVEGTGYPWQLTKDELTFTDNKPYALLISGSKNDGVVGTNPFYYAKLLQKNGNEVIVHEMKSTGHDHSSVTPHLYNFLRIIFN